MRIIAPERIRKLSREVAPYWDDSTIPPKLKPGTPQEIKDKAKEVNDFYIKCFEEEAKA